MNSVHLSLHLLIQTPSIHHNQSLSQTSPVCLFFISLLYIQLYVSAFNEIIMQMLAKDPSQRLTLTQLFSLPYVIRHAEQLQIQIPQLTQTPVPPSPTIVQASNQQTTSSPPAGEKTFHIFSQQQPSHSLQPQTSLPVSYPPTQNSLHNSDVSPSSNITPPLSQSYTLYTSQPYPLPNPPPTPNYSPSPTTQPYSHPTVTDPPEDAPHSSSQLTLLNITELSLFLSSPSISVDLWYIISNVNQPPPAVATLPPSSLNFFYLPIQTQDALSRNGWSRIEMTLTTSTKFTAILFGNPTPPLERFRQNIQASPMQIFFFFAVKTNSNPDQPRVTLSADYPIFLRQPPNAISPFHLNTVIVCPLPPPLLNHSSFILTHTSDCADADLMSDEDSLTSTPSLHIHFDQLCPSIAFPLTRTTPQNCNGQICSPSSLPPSSNRIGWQINLTSPAEWVKIFNVPFTPKQCVITSFILNGHLHGISSNHAYVDFHIPGIEDKQYKRNLFVFDYSPLPSLHQSAFYFPPLPSRTPATPPSFHPTFVFPHKSDIPPSSVSLSGDWTSQSLHIQPWSLRLPLVFDTHSLQSTLHTTLNGFLSTQHPYVFDNNLHHFCFRTIKMIESNPHLTSASLYPLSFLDDQFEHSPYHPTDTQVDTTLTQCSNNLDVLSTSPPSQDSFNIPCYARLKNGDEILSIRLRKCPQFSLPLIPHPERKDLVVCNLKHYATLLHMNSCPLTDTGLIEFNFIDSKQQLRTLPFIPTLAPTKSSRQTDACNVVMYRDQTQLPLLTLSSSQLQSQPSIVDAEEPETPDQTPTMHCRVSLPAHSIRTHFILGSWDDYKIAFPLTRKSDIVSIDLLTNKWIKAFLYDSLIKENTVSPHTQLVLSIICMPDSTQSLPFDEVREQFNKFNTPCCFQLCTSR